MWLPLTQPLLETWPATQVCAVTRNRTHDPLVHRPVLNLLSHTSQAKFLMLFNQGGHFILQRPTNHMAAPQSPPKSRLHPICPSPRHRYPTQPLGRSVSEATSHLSSLHGARTWRCTDLQIPSCLTQGDSEEERPYHPGADRRTQRPSGAGEPLQPWLPWLTAADCG